MATHVPREPHEIRILNPYFIQEAAFSFIGLPFNNGLMGRGVSVQEAYPQYDTLFCAADRKQNVNLIHDP